MRSRSHRAGPCHRPGLCHPAAPPHRSYPRHRPGPGRRLLSAAGVTLVILTLGGLPTAPPAGAFNPLKPICGAVGLVSGIAGKACKVAQNGGQLLSAGKKLLGGHVESAAKTAVGGGSTSSNLAAKAAFVVGLAAVGAWVVGGAKVALEATGKLIDRSTRPQLQTTWFSATYWRVAGIAAVLTLPFLFAAAIQALVHSDLALLARSALGYLPISLLAVSVAAPITMLLLAVSDGMSGAITSASAGAGTRFLAELGGLGGVTSLTTSSPFVTFFVGLMLVAAAVVLWVEMLMRDAAIYIVVLMLPLVFAGFVWPARRGWAIRTIELLFALILSKFAVVCVLALGGGALGQGLGHGPGGMLIGLVLVTLAALAPWALVRLLPMAEVAGAVGSLRGELPVLRAAHQLTPGAAEPMADWATSLPSLMSRQAEDAVASSRSGSDGPADRGSAVDPETQKLRAQDGVPAFDGDPRPVADGPSSDSPRKATVDRPDGHVAAGGRPDGEGSSDDRPPQERQPGMAAGYQQPDMSWAPVMLGPEAQANGFGGLAGNAPRTQQPDADPSGGDDARAELPEDHDPLPPSQPTGDGPL